MKKRLKPSDYIIIVTFLFITLLTFVIFFYFQEYRILALSVMLCSVGGLNLYVGITQIKMTKKTSRIAQYWWKNYLIIMALFWEGIGLIECIVWLSDNNKIFASEIDTLAGNILALLFVVFTICVGIYGIALTLQYIAANRKAKQAP